MTNDPLVIEGEFKRAGVRVEYVLASYEDTPEGQLSKNVRAIIAEYKRLKIDERLTRGRRNKVKAGQVVCSERPYGYKIVKTDGAAAFEIYEPEARIVRMVFEWHVNERLGPDLIARRLTDMGIPTYRGAKDWNPRSIHKMVAKETYAGVWHYDDLTMDIPGIIDRELWDGARARAKENKARAKRNRKHSYLLSGRVRCGHCQSGMTGNTPKQHSYYYCPVHYHPSMYERKCDGDGGYFRADWIEAETWAAVKEWIIDPERTARVFAAYQTEKDAINAPLYDRLALINEQLEATKGKLARLLDLRIDGEIGKEMYQERKGQLEILRAGLDKEQSAIEATINAVRLTQEQIKAVVDFAIAIKDQLETNDGDPEFQAAVLDALRIEVVLLKENGEKVGYVYSDVFGQEKIRIGRPATWCWVR